MRNGTDKPSGKKGAVICAVVVIGFLLLYLLSFLIPVLGEEMSGAAVVILVLLIAGMILAVIIGVIVALRQRLREIQNGEEDDASQYSEPGDGCPVSFKNRRRKSMLLLNIDHVPGREIEALGIVKGTVVQSKNFGKDFMAGMKTLVGGEITGYTEMLVEARQIATKRMVDEAAAMGADAVINIRFGSSSVMQGAAEVLAYGTAVRYK